MGTGNCSKGTRPDCARALGHDVPRFGALSKEVTPLLLLDLSIIGGCSTRLLLELFIELSVLYLSFFLSNYARGEW